MPYSIFATYLIWFISFMTFGIFHTYIEDFLIDKLACHTAYLSIIYFILLITFVIFHA